MLEYCMPFHTTITLNQQAGRIFVGLCMIVCFAWVSGETLQSKSGQFVITWADDLVAKPRLNTLERSQGLIALTPDLISLTAERIKDGMIDILGVQDTWRNKIRITISSARRSNQPFVTIPTRYANGWGFRIVLKPKIREDIWIRNLVHVILLEIVNRPSPEHMCDPPTWLIEGIRQNVVHSSLVDHSLTVGDMIEVGNPNNNHGRPVPWFYKRKSTFIAKEFLRTQSPLSAEQIFHASPELAETYNFKHCAHMMFAELMQMHQGAGSMQRFIELLPQYFNSQTAFHKAYSQTFPNMLELEKWWAVITASVTQFNEKRRWDMEKSLTELGGILNPPAKVALDKNSLPIWRTYAFKDVLTDWSGEKRIAQIDHITQQLQLLKAQSLLEVIPLLDQYINMINRFKDQMTQVGFATDKRGQLVARESQIVNRTLRSLAQLEKEREGFLAKYKALDNVAAATGANTSQR